MEDVKFTFLLPAYKARFFQLALESIKNQSYSNFKCIVSDDCSPENLKNIFDSVCAEDHRFTYRRNFKNLGSENLVSHWNLLLNKCSSPYFIMASDDDIFHVEFLETLNALTEKYPDVSMIRSRTQKIDSTGKMLQLEGEYQEYNDGIDFYKQFFCSDYIPCIANILFKTNLLKEMGGFIDFPLAIGSDDATTLSLSKYGVVNTKDILFSFRVSGINLSDFRNTDPKILAKKMKAINLFSEWISKDFANIMERNFDTNKIKDIKYGIFSYLHACMTGVAYQLNYLKFLNQIAYMYKKHLIAKNENFLKLNWRWFKNNYLSK